MYKTIRVLFTGLLIIASINTSNAQTRTFSPATRYGIGELNYRGFGRNDAMGGTGIGVRSSRHLNNLNPASYSAIDSLSFFFEVGTSGSQQSISGTDNSETFSDLNFDYFAFGFPISSRFAVSLGIRPIAQSGYRFEFTHQPDNIETLQTALGLGNFTTAYGGLSFEVAPNLSAGVHASYWFGKITHTSFQEFINDPRAKSFGLKNQHHVNSLLLDFGVQKTFTNNAGHNIILGAVFRPKTPMNGTTETITASGYDKESDGNLFLTNDTISASKTKWSSNNNFQMPMNMGVGVSYEIQDQLTLAADYSTQRWGSADFPDNVTNTTNTNMFGLGAEYIPNERAGTRYLQRVRYRAGVRYYEDYIKINDYQVTDLGMTFGLGLPLRRSNTSINLGFEYGKRGTAESGQMSETYTRFTLNLTMHEHWFRQRRFD